MGLQPKVFVREATGLVRNVGLIDQFLISQGIANGFNGFIFTALFAPFFFPGAYLPVVFIIGSIPGFAMAYVYSVMSTAMPRSGGDYVWSTRIIGPLFGTIQIIFVVGATIQLAASFASYVFAPLGLAQLFLSLGVTTNNSGLISLASSVSGQSLGFTIDIAVFFLSVVMAVISLRTYLWFQRIGMVFYYIAGIAFLILVATLSSASFPGIFNHAMSVAGSNATYAGVVQTAKSSGFAADSINWNNTLLAAIPWGFLTFTGFNYGTYLAGETKNVKSSIYRALFISALFTTAILVLLSLFSYNSFGFAFLNSASYVYTTNAGLFPTYPTTSLFISFLNPGVAALIGVAILLVLFINVTSDIITMARILFAASFDRLLPARFANVSERFHTPHISVLVVSFFWGLIIVIYWFVGFIASMLNTAIVVPIGYGLPFVATMVFYYRKRELFDRTIGKGPALLIFASVVALASFGFYIFALVFPITSGVYLGASLGLAVGIVVTLGLLGVVIYALAGVRAKRAGVSLAQIYAEIPPE